MYRKVGVGETLIKESMEGHRTSASSFTILRAGMLAQTPEHSGIKYLLNRQGLK